MEILLLFAGGLLMAALLRARPVNARAAASDGAARVRAEIDAVYGGEHQYCPASPAEFPTADHAFYDATTAEFVRRGFVKVGDLEDLTVTKAYPLQRTFSRMFVDDGQLIRAAVMHIRTRGVMIGLLQILRATPRSVRVIELVSESSSGHFLVTATTRGIDRLNAPPTVDIERHEPGTKVSLLIERHVERLRNWLRAHPGYAPCTMANIDDVIESAQRGNLVASQHRKAVGGLSRDELERIKGSPLTAIDDEFLAHLQHPPIVDTPPQ